MMKHRCLLIWEFGVVTLSPVMTSIPEIKSVFCQSALGNINLAYYGRITRIMEETRLPEENLGLQLQTT